MKLDNTWEPGEEDLARFSAKIVPVGDGLLEATLRS